MPLAEAEALLARPLAKDAQAKIPEACFQPLDPAADLDKLRQLAVNCERFTPLFGIEKAESPECVLLDVTGCLHLFGGAQQMSTDIATWFDKRDYHTRIALAPTIGAAWAAAHHLAQPRLPVVVPFSQLRETLLPLHVDSLRLTFEILTTLCDLGLRSISQLQKLPRASLPSRFGPLLLKRLNQAFGDEPEFFIAEKPREPFIARWEGEFPIKSREALHAVSHELLDQLLSRLKVRREGIRLLRCELRDCCRKAYEFRVGFTAPTDQTKHTFEMLCLQWDQATLPEEIDMVLLEAVVTGSLQIVQRDLFGHELGDDENRDVVTLLDRLSNRLGAEAVVRGRLLPEAQPELAVSYDPYTSHEAKLIHGECFKTRLSQRPTLLFTRPEPIEVLAIERNSPQSFRWNHREHRVVRSWQERIVTGWWRATPARRDYFRVEVHTGHHLWIYQRLVEQDWFIHGIFD